MAKLSVNLVVWNGTKYIPLLFDSLRKQIYKDFVLHILDNNSTDNTVELIKKELNNFFVQADLEESKTNSGFAGGHNRLFKKTDTDYVMLLNQDMYLLPDCLEKIAGFLNDYPGIGSVTPRLMKWDFSAIYSTLNESFTNKVDSLGLEVMRSRRVIEWQAGRDWDTKDFESYKADKCNHDSCAVKIFGCSGALPVYKLSALDEVAFENGDVFDSLYGSYKEDVDLAFRLASAGFDSYVILDAVAYHDRTGFGPDKGSNEKKLAKNKEKQPYYVKYNSYKNHLMTIYKNEYWQNFMLDFPWILWYELRKFAYFLLFDRDVLKGLPEIFRNRRALAGERRQVKAKRRINWRKMRRFWDK